MIEVRKHPAELSLLQASFLPQKCVRHFTLVKRFDAYEFLMKSYEKQTWERWTGAQIQLTLPLWAPLLQSSHLFPA